MPAPGMARVLQAGRVTLSRYNASAAYGIEFVSGAIMRIFLADTMPPGGRRKVPKAGKARKYRQCRQRLHNAILARFLALLYAQVFGAFRVDSRPLCARSSGMRFCNQLQPSGGCYQGANDQIIFCFFSQKVLTRLLQVFRIQGKQYARTAPRQGGNPGGRQGA